MLNTFRPYQLVIIAGLLLSAAVPGRAAPKVVAQVSEKRVVEGQSITFEIRSENGRIQIATLLGLKDFELLSGPSSSHSVQVINGAVTSSSSYRWTLMPKRSGRLEIPAQTVTVDGRRVRTELISIQVEPAGAATGGGAQGGTSSLFILTQVDREELYRGEQLTVTWTLYTKVNISGWEVVSLPNLTGFWTEELFAPSKLQLREELIEGQRYYSAVVRRLALFPTRSGALEVDPLVLKIGVQSRRRRRSRDPFFDDFSFLSPGRVENKVLSSPALKIHVKPIPTSGRPADYRGVVGDFTLSGGLDYQEVEQDQAVTLTVIISGRGNTKTLEAPPVRFPSSLEVFDPKVSAEPSLGDVVGGSKTLEYVIIPRLAGEFTIPPIRLTYFEPRDGHFLTSTIGPFHLKVAPRPGGVVSTTGFSRQEVAILGKDIRFRKSTRPRWLKTGQGWYTPGILLLNVATMFFFAAPWLGQRVRVLATSVGPGLAVRRAYVAAQAMIEKASGEPAQIYGQFSRAVTLYLNRRLGRNDQEYTVDEVAALLERNGAPTEQKTRLLEVLQQSAAARFAPVVLGNVETDRAALLAALKELDRQWVA